MDVNEIDSGDHSAIYTNIRSLYKLKSFGKPGVCHCELPRLEDFSEETAGNVTSGFWY